MKKNGKALLITTICCMIMWLTGCGVTPTPEPEPQGGGSKPTVTAAEDKDDKDDKNPEKEPTDAKETAKVIAIYQGNSGEKIEEEFDFDEKDEHFAADRRWILNLNGNSIIIDDTIRVKGEVVVTNGTIVPKISDMLKLEMNATFTLGKTEYGDITVCCYKGFDGIKTVDGFYVDEAVINVYGGIGIREEYIDYGGAVDYEKVSCINVYGGIGMYVAAGQRGYCWDNVMVNAFENGVGIENHGNCGHRSVTAKGGTAVVNLAGSEYYGENLYVESGLGVYNKGNCTLGNATVVKSGMAVKNEGTLQINFLTTIPGENYSDTLVYNDLSGEITEAGICIVTGKNAVGIDNHGLLSGPLRLAAGIPTGDSIGFGLWNYSYSDILMPYMDYLQAGRNTIVDTVICINEEDGIADTTRRDDGYLYLFVALNATEDANAPYTESVVGFMNKSKKSNDFDDIYVYMNGHGGYGVVNCADALISSSGDYVQIMVYDSNTGMPGDNAEYGEETIGFLNEGRITGKRINCSMYGNKNTGFMNSGSIILSFEYGGAEFNIYGTENKALVNNGSCTSTGFMSYAHGENGYLIVNTGSLAVTQNRLYAEVLGLNNVGILNSGILMADNLYVGNREGYGYDADAAIGLHNLNLVECTDLTVQMGCISKGTGLLNDESGNIKTEMTRVMLGNEYVDEGGVRNNYGIVNHGVMTSGKEYMVSIGSSSCTGLLNDGNFTCGAFTAGIHEDVSGSSIYNNAGSMTIRDRVYIQLYEGCRNSWRTNSGSIAVLGDWYAVCYLEDSQYELLQQ